MIWRANWLNERCPLSVEVCNGSELVALQSPLVISGCCALLCFRRGGTGQSGIIFRLAMAKRGTLPRRTYRVGNRRYRRAGHFLCRPAARRNLENDQRRYDLVPDL